MEIKTIEISGFATALKGLRLPFKKEVRSEIQDIEIYYRDNFRDDIEFKSPIKYGADCMLDYKDLKLLQALIKKGDDHAKVLRFITVSAEIQAPRYFWSEMDTYRLGVEKISESTMHTILNEEITRNNFDIYTDEVIIGDFIDIIYEIKLNNKTSTNQKIERIKCILPEGYLQKRIIQFNYQSLRRIYLQRKEHKLSVWNIDFCNWIKTLPLSNELITLEK